MTNDQLTTALQLAQKVGKERFTNIGDISCDVEVSSFLDLTVWPVIIAISQGWP
jgi:hypothetical protein